METCFLCGFLRIVGWSLDVEADYNGIHFFEPLSLHPRQGLGLRVSAASQMAMPMVRNCGFRT